MALQRPGSDARVGVVDDSDVVVEDELEQLASGHDAAVLDDDDAKRRARRGVREEERMLRVPADMVRGRRRDDRAGAVEQVDGETVLRGRGAVRPRGLSPGEHAVDRLAGRDGDAQIRIVAADIRRDDGAHSADGRIERLEPGLEEIAAVVAGGGEVVDAGRNGGGDRLVEQRPGLIPLFGADRDVVDDDVAAGRLQRGHGGRETREIAARVREVILRAGRDRVGDLRQGPALVRAAAGLVAQDGDVGRQRSRGDVAGGAAGVVETVGYDSDFNARAGHAVQAGRDVGAERHLRRVLGLLLNGGGRRDRVRHRLG